MIDVASQRRPGREPGPTADMLSCFQAGAVVDNLVSTDKFTAIAEVIERATVFGDRQQRQSVERAVLARERIETTGIGHGVAACHGRTKEVAEVVVALGISRQGIDFEAGDGEPVHLLFVFATPPGWHRDYLLALAGICKLSKQQFLASLLDGPADEIRIQQRLHDAFTDVTARAARSRKNATRKTGAAGATRGERRNGARLGVGSMLIIPAIDVMDGEPVQLQQGDFARSSRYEVGTRRASAVDAARRLQDWGASWIHMVDLDAARGSGSNRPVVEAVRRAVDCRLQVGGGVREVADAKALVDIGVDRVVVGSPLATDRELPTRWGAAVAGRLVAAIDADHGHVRVRGWQEDSGFTDVEVAESLSQQPLEGLVFTTIERDGMMTGPDVARSRTVASAFGGPLVVSGGVGSDDDLRAVAAAVAEPDSHIAGAIVGTAWYQGRVDLSGLMREYDQQKAGARW